MSVISLPADCNREAAIATWAQVKGDAPGAHTFDGAQVERIGQAMMQVLLVAMGDRPVANPSPALIDTAHLAGLDAALLRGAHA